MVVKRYTFDKFGVSCRVMLFFKLR